jgi:nucleotide-binding universal stress UspA family protein
MLHMRYQLAPFTIPIAGGWASWHHRAMAELRKRRSYEEGHRRKMLVVIDESPEAEVAMYFCASRIVHSSGAILLLYIIEPEDFQTWVGVRQVHIEEETNKAKALFRLARRKLNSAGFENVATEEVIREGKKAEEIVRLIEEDEDIGILVLGASSDPKGPGPLVSSLATGKTAGSFPIPISIVPGNLTVDDLKAMG